MKTPNISIILPIYNVESYLEECLESLRSQSLSGIEIICVNDGSTDNSKNILKKYVESDSRIKLINQDNSGQGIARNNGIKIATGEYIGFVDPDDWVEPEMFENLYRAARNFDADIVEESFIIDNEARNYIKKSRNKLKLPKNQVYNYKIRQNYLFSVNLAVWNKIYRTEFIRENNIEFMDLLRSEDIYFTVKSRILANKIVYIDSPDYHYRIKSDDKVLINHDLAQKKNNGVFYFVKNFKDKLVEDNIYEITEPDFKKWRNDILIDYYWKFAENKKQFINDVHSFLELEQFVLFFISIICREFFGNIFSVYNTYLEDKKYKIFKILGFKIKIRHNKIKFR